MLPLVFLTRLVELGVHELAGDVNHSPDRARTRTAIDMHVKYAEVDRDSGQRAITQPAVFAAHFHRRLDLNDLGHDPVRWRHQQVVATRDHPLRIAEERQNT